MAATQVLKSIEATLETKQEEQAEKAESPSSGYMRFVKATSAGEELVTIILRSHLLTEYYIDQIIMATMSRGDLILDDSRTTFSYKLALLKSLNVLIGETACLIDSASGLNKVRNDCSHTLDYKISEIDIDKIGNPHGVYYLNNKLKKGDNLKGLLLDTLMYLIARLDGSAQFYIEKKEKDFKK